MARFGKPLVSGQVAMILVTVNTAVTAILALQITTSSAGRVGRELADDLQLAQRVRLQAERLVATSRAYLLTGEERYRLRFAETERELDVSLERLAMRARVRDVGAGTTFWFVIPSEKSSPLFQEAKRLP